MKLRTFLSLSKWEAWLLTICFLAWGVWLSGVLQVTILSKEPQVHIYGPVSSSSPKQLVILLHSANSSGPDMAYLAAIAVSEKQVDKAILVCGTGIGMSIAANKIKGIRAALCHDELSAHISRHHNDANVLCVSGDLTGEVLLRKIVEAWLNTEFHFSPELF